MYTGTLIRDLILTVEQAEEQGARARLIAGEQELDRLFELQTVAKAESAFAGAA